MSIGGNLIPIAEYSYAGLAVEVYRLTFANTDTGDFASVTTRMTKPKFARVTSEVQAQNGGRLLRASVSNKTVTVSIHNGGGTQAPTSVLLEVVGEP